MKLKKLVSVVLVFAVLFSSAVISTRAETQISIPFLENVIKATDFLGAGINDTAVFLRPTGNPDISEFYLSYKENDGEEKIIGFGVYYDKTKNEVYGWNYDQGVFESGFGYDVDDRYFFTTQDAWQRQFGFTPLYDMLAPLFGFNYATRRIFFDYDGKEWMVQLWKGNYGYNNFMGGEVGIYNRPAGTKNGLFYNCVTDEEMVPISMKVYDDSRVYIDREPLNTWWMTGFVFSDGRVSLSKIHMDSAIEFPNEEMCKAFADSADDAYGVECTVEGTTAYIVW